MIKFCPKWCIFEMDGKYFVCRKPGGLMASGFTLEAAKEAYRKKDEKEKHRLEEYSDEAF